MNRGLLCILIVACFLVATTYCAPVDVKDPSGDAKSAFGVPFDEIVVDTSLTVKRKNPDRQSRKQTAQLGGVGASVTPVKKPGSS